MSWPYFTFVVLRAEDIFNSDIVRHSMWHAGLLFLLTFQGELGVCPWGLLSAVDMMLEEKKLGAMQSESTIRRLHVPVLRPEDVIHHLGSPTHWQPGRSAKSVADLWFSANGLPPSVKSALDHDPAFKGATLVDAFFERPVDLGDGQRPSQTDLMAILRLDGRLGVLAVEAKVDETFGPTVQEWLSEQKEMRPHAQPAWSGYAEFSISIRRRSGQSDTNSSTARLLQSSKPNAIARAMQR